MASKKKTFVFEHHQIVFYNINKVSWLHIYFLDFSVNLHTKRFFICMRKTFYKFNVNFQTKYFEYMIYYMNPTTQLGKVRWSFSHIPSWYVPVRRTSHIWCTLKFLNKFNLTKRSCHKEIKNSFIFKW